MGAVLQNWDTRVPTEVESVSGFSSKIGTIPPNSGRLETLQRFFGGSWGIVPREKNRTDLRSSNCWKCIGIVNLTITTLFFYHFKSFTIPSGGPFWLLGGGGGRVRAHPALSPCLRAWISPGTIPNNKVPGLR